MYLLAEPFTRGKWIFHFSQLSSFVKYVDKVTIRRTEPANRVWMRTCAPNALSRVAIHIAQNVYIVNQTSTSVVSPKIVWFLMQFGLPEKDSKFCRKMQQQQKFFCEFRSLHIKEIHSSPLITLSGLP